MRLDGAQAIRIADIPRPEPVDPADAIVRVTTAAVDPADLERYAAEAPADVTPGGACAGVVEVIGSAVQRWRPGDSVVAPAVLMVPGRAVLGRDLPGSHAGWLRVPAADANLVALPDPLNFEAQAVVVAGTFVPGVRAARIVGMLSRSPEPASICVVGCGAASLAFISAWKTAKGHAGGNLVAVDDAPGRVLLARRSGALGVVARGAAAKTDAPSEQDALTAAEVRARAARETFNAVVVGARAEGASLALALLLAGDCPLILLDPPGTGWAAREDDQSREQFRVVGDPVPDEIARHVEDLTSGKLDLLPLISHTFPLAEAKAAYEAALGRGRGILKVLLKA